MNRIPPGPGKDAFREGQADCWAGKDKRPSSGDKKIDRFYERGYQAAKMRINPKSKITRGQAEYLLLKDNLAKDLEIGAVQQRKDFITAIFETADELEITTFVRRIYLLWLDASDKLTLDRVADRHKLEMARVETGLKVIMRTRSTLKIPRQFAKSCGIKKGARVSFWDTIDGLLLVGKYVIGHPWEAIVDDSMCVKVPSLLLKRLGLKPGPHLIFRVDFRAGKVEYSPRRNGKGAKAWNTPEPQIIERVRNPQQGTQRIVSERQDRLLTAVADDILTDVKAYEQIRNEPEFAEILISAKEKHPELLRRLYVKHDNEVVSRAYRELLRRVAMNIVD